MYPAFHSLSQTIERKENTEGEKEGEKERKKRKKNTYKETWLMHLCQSIHFTAITVWSWGGGAHFSEKHGAFSLHISQFPRAAGGWKDTFPPSLLLRVSIRTVGYFITSLFTWSTNQGRSQFQFKKAAPASCLPSRIVQSGASQDANGIPDGSSFPGSCGSDRKTWEFVAIWRCLGNALSSSDLNCYSLYLQEFQPEAGILY